MNEAGRLTGQSYWEDKLESAVEEPPEFPFFGMIARHLPPGDGRSLLEVGCAPGRSLAQFSAELGYEAFGVDFAGDPVEIESYLRRHGANLGAVERADFLTWAPARRYDVVTSFGFIEHFAEPASILDRHFDLVEPGGVVVIGVPNFRLGQHALHWLFDRENLRRHQLSCMRRSFFEAACVRHDARLSFLGYCGGHYDFWRLRPRSVRLGVEAYEPEGAPVAGERCPPRYQGHRRRRRRIRQRGLLAIPLGDLRLRVSARAVSRNVP